MGLFNKKQVYVSVKESPAWNLNKGGHKVRIVTFVFERSFLWLHFFKVKQFIPLIKEPLCDGEYASNRSVKADAVEEKAKAYKWIYSKKGK